MKIRAISPTGEVFCLVGEGSCDLNSIKKAFREQTKLNPNKFQFFQNGKLITLSTVIKADENEDEVTIACLNREEFPDLQYPHTEMNFHTDFDRFTHVEFKYPMSFVPQYIRERAKPKAGNYIRNMSWEFSNPYSSRKQFVLKPRDAENTTYQEYDDETDDIDQEIGRSIGGRQISEQQIADTYNHLTIEQQNIIHNLTDLGFDRYFVFQVCYMCGFNEEVALQLLTTIIR